MNIRRFSRGLIVLSLLGLFIFPLVASAHHPCANYLYVVSDVENILLYMPRNGLATATQIGPLGVSNVEATALSLVGIHDVGDVGLAEATVPPYDKDDLLLVTTIMDSNELTYDSEFSRLNQFEPGTFQIINGENMIVKTTYEMNKDG